MEKNIFKQVSLQASSSPKVRKVEWDDPVEVMFHMRDMRLSERLRILDQLVPKRICSSCGLIKINTASWVVNKDKSRAICRSCFHRHLPDNVMEENSKLRYKLFVGTFIRYALSAMEITRARSAINISVNEFARQAGWTSTYQYKLEDGSVKTVTSDVAETILEVFLRYGYYTEDEL